MRLVGIDVKPGKGACTFAIVVGYAVMAFASTAFAVSTNSWKSAGRVNDWDWTEPGNFVEGVAPVAGDFVKLPTSTDIFVTNAASLSLVATLEQVLTVSGARIIFSVAENESVSLDCAICSAAYHANSDSMTGEIVKRGLGTLILARADGHQEQQSRAPTYTDRYAYCTCITCEEGSLKFPTSAESGGYSHFMGRLSVSNNATVYTVKGGNYTVPSQLWGDGVITNDGSKVATLRVQGVLAAPCVFSGRIGGPIYYQSYGNVMLTGTDNTFTTESVAAYASTRFTNVDDLSSYRSKTGIMKFGKKGERATLSPTVTSFQTYVFGGRFLYIGDEADECDRTFTVGSPNDGIAVLDGGHHGELTLSGTFDMSTDSRYIGMAMVAFAGSNEYPCVISGPISQKGTNDYFFVKVGSGAWRFADTTTDSRNRKFATTVTLKEGTLQFDSLTDAGQFCSLGVSTNWSAAYYGAHTKAYATNYAFLAGAAYGSARPATLEYTGSKRSIAVATRPIGLLGNLSLRNDTAKAWRFSGVGNTTGKAVTLDLTGSGTATNELYGIRDTKAAPISVTKTGSGTWTLDGSNTLHGAISVEGGTLKVREAKGGNYTWFRFTIREKNGSTTHYLHFNELGIYDAEGNRLNLNLSTNNTDYAVLAPGQIAYGRDRIVWWRANSLLQIINGSTAILEFRDEDTVNPIPGDPTTWLPFVMRLPEGSAAADAYDVCVGQSYNSSGDDKNRVFTSWTMEGSVDGVHWDVLSITNNAQPMKDVWVGSGVAYSGNSSDTTHLNGMKLERSGIGEVPTTVLDDVVTVSVATNCTLEAEGSLSLKALTLNAAGNGTIKGFAFAESGTVDVVNLGAGVKEATFDMAFEDVTGLQNLTRWTLTIGGERAANRVLTFGRDGKLRLVSRGFMLMVR